MKSIFFTLALLMLGCGAYSQDKSKEYCVRTKRITDAEIQKLFPYNLADRIEVVSYKGILSKDSIRLHTIPKRDGKVDLGRLFEEKRLNPQLKGELIDILINYNYDPKFGDEVEATVMMCYDPRNAVLFIDKSGNVIGYIEICFECLEYKLEPKTVVVGNFCFDKFKMLKDFFKKAGITYGLEETID